MNSATSIDTGTEKTTAPAGLTAGQFFLLVALGCATAATVMARGQGVTTIILLTLMIGSTALVGMAALRTLNPLVSDEDDRTAVVGSRTRAALEREKFLVLRAIKELEFDHAMGKVSDADFEEMSSRMRSRAARLIRALDAGAGYRDQIEHDLAKRLGADDATLKTSRPDDIRAGSPDTARGAGLPGTRACACGTPNDRDAKFCKACGRQL